MVQAEPWARAEHGQRPPIAGLVPALSERADPAVTLWTAEAGDRLTELRTRAAEDLAVGDTPAWTAALGARPADPAQARAWADHAAQVALYRQAAGVTGTELLGPNQPPRSPLGPARRVASHAASAAQRLGAGEQPDTPRSAAPTAHTDAPATTGTPYRTPGPEPRPLTRRHARACRGARYLIGRSFRIATRRAGPSTK